ncbi:MAG: DUF2155 domain-containing protein [Alphaproteobacteria bacterium]|nr:DUF2155 domain-containing protein [Alphaproteobacteria bacterium]
MSIQKLLLITLFPLFCSCNSYAFIEKNTADLVVLDKVSGKTQNIQVDIDKPVQYDKLTIVVKNCKQSDPFEAENFYVFLEIYSQKTDRIFSGWMNRNEPSENPLQNVDYDVWVKQCK